MFSNLPPGQYRLTVTCDGFIRQEYSKASLSQWSKPRGTSGLNSRACANGRRTCALDSYGEPVPNLVVEAMRRSYEVRGNPRLTRVASAVSDDRGDYRIFWLDPGDYHFLRGVVFAGRLRSRAPERFYADVLSRCQYS